MTNVPPGTPPGHIPHDWEIEISGREAGVRVDVFLWGHDNGAFLVPYDDDATPEKLGAALTERGLVLDPVQLAHTAHAVRRVQRGEAPDLPACLWCGSPTCPVCSSLPEENEERRPCARCSVPFSQLGGPGDPVLLVCPDCLGVPRAEVPFTDLDDCL